MLREWRYELVCSDDDPGSSLARLVTVAPFASGTGADCILCTFEPTATVIASPSSVALAESAALANVALYRVDVQSGTVHCTPSLFDIYGVEPTVTFNDMMARFGELVRHVSDSAGQVSSAAHALADNARLYAAVAQAINRLMATQGRFPLAIDVGDCLFTALDIDHSHRVAPGYYASMGFAVPAGLGLQAASGRRPARDGEAVAVHAGRRIRGRCACCARVQRPGLRSAAA